MTAYLQLQLVRVLNCRKFYEASSASGWQLVLAGRLSPVPSYMCNYGFSATNVSFHDYMLATFLASFPMVVQNTYMGSMAKNIGDVFSGVSSEK